MLKVICKSLLALSLLALPFCVAGCSSDDDKNEGDTEWGNGEYQISDLVGTWEIVHSKYTCKKNGVVFESGDEDVSDEHNRFVFYSNNHWEFHEYSDTKGTWHEDGTGIYYLRNNQLVFTGDVESFSIVSLTKTKLVAKYKFVEEKGEDLYEDEYIDTMERVSN